MHFLAQVLASLGIDPAVGAGLADDFIFLTVQKTVAIATVLWCYSTFIGPLIGAASEPAKPNGKKKSHTK